MRTRIKIEPLSKSSSIILTGAYHNPKTNDMIYIDSNLEFHKKTIPADKREFSRTIRPKSNFIFDVDTENKSDMALLAFWENHPQVQVVGKENPNLKVPTFTLSNLQEAETLKNTSIHSRYEIASKIFSMSEAELNSLIFALNGDPRDMSDVGSKENFLIGDDFISGRAMMNAEKFHKYVDSPEKERRVQSYVFKAIRLGVIPSIDNIYMYNGKHLGATPEHAINYFMSDVELLESVIIPEVDLREKPSGNTTAAARKGK
jgi:hypothetical protein